MSIDLSFVLTATTEEVKKQRFRQRITDYMGRAEKLKQHVEEEKQCNISINMH